MVPSRDLGRHTFSARTVCFSPPIVSFRDVSYTRTVVAHHQPPLVCSDKEYCIAHSTYQDVRFKAKRRGNEKIGHSPDRKLMLSHSNDTCTIPAQKPSSCSEATMGHNDHRLGSYYEKGCLPQNHLKIFGTAQGPDAITKLEGLRRSWGSATLQRPRALPTLPTSQRHET